MVNTTLQSAAFKLGQCICIIPHYQINVNNVFHTKIKFVWYIISLNWQIFSPLPMHNVKPCLYKSLASNYFRPKLFQLLLYIRYYTSVKVNRIIGFALHRQRWTFFFSLWKKISGGQILFPDRDIEACFIGAPNKTCFACSYKYVFSKREREFWV